MRLAEANPLGWLDGAADRPAPNEDMLWQVKQLLTTTAPPRSAPEARAPRQNAEMNRDLNHALDLVGMASGLLEKSETRIRQVEEHAHKLAQGASLQLKAAHDENRRLEQQLRDAERRAEQAEARLREANDWIARFHDAITSAFKSCGQPPAAR